MEILHLGLLKQLYFCKEIKFSSENFFFYKNKIALTSPTLWLKKDFALFME